MEVSALTERNLKGVTDHLRHYLELRFAYAQRVNPHLGSFAQELIWHQIENMRRVLSANKPIGERRIIIVDEMVGFDPVMKRDIFSPTNQISILAETVEAAAEDSGAAKTTAISIRDVRSLYTHIDPKLAPTLDLLQTWTWWDLPDSVDKYVLDTQIEKVRKLKRGQFNDKLLAYYKKEMAGEGTVSPQGILEFELKRTVATLESIELRRSDEKPNAILIAFEKEASDGRTDRDILELAQRLKAAARIEETEEIDAGQIEHYARAIGRPAEQVTAEAALKWEREQADRLRAQVAAGLSGVEIVKEFYDYKARELPVLKKKFQALRQEFARKPAAAAATA